MAEEKIIKKVDDKHVAIITTTENEQIFKKTTLESQKIAKTEQHQKEIADMDELLAVFD